MSTNKNTHNGSKGLVEAGLAIGAIAAGAAGAYFMFGSKKAKQNRAHMKSWVYKAKSEVIDRMEQLKNVSEDEYKKLVDTVINTYQNKGNVSVQEVAQIAKDLKAHWKNIRNDIKKHTSTRSTTAKPSAKKKTAK
jgi:gas vesicle protein